MVRSVADVAPGSALTTRFSDGTARSVVESVVAGDGQGKGEAVMAQKGGTGQGRAETPVGELSYTEASRELDEIVAFFEGRDVDVDQLVLALGARHGHRRRAGPAAAPDPGAGGGAGAPSGLGGRRDR